MAHMPAPPETVEVETIDIFCDGGGGALGHPKVYLTLVNGEVECPLAIGSSCSNPVSPASGH